MTISDTILKDHSVNKNLKHGDVILADIDIGVATDATMPLAIKEFNKVDKPVFDPQKIALVQDHFVPAKDIMSANFSKEMRNFAIKHNITNYFEIGRGGICHHIIPDSGLVYPGDLIIGADSHTCTYGAFGSFSTGIGSTDFAAFMATGKLWLKVPESIKVILEGKKRKYVQGKDIVLKLISVLGVDGASYKTIEFAGTALSLLDISDRITICNMAIEAGAKTGIFEVDEVTEDFYKKFKNKKELVRLTCGHDDEYERVIRMDISEIEPLVAKPFLPSNVQPVSAIDTVNIDQAFIGSCTNGRIEDMRMAGEVLKGKHINDRVRMIVIPGTHDILKQMVNEGLMRIFLDSGAVISSPTCGPCLGGHTGILGDDEICISTSNRNFVGRMGATSSKLYLANPAVVAASAIKGQICHPEEIL